MQRRLPRIAEQGAPKLGAWAVWVYHPLITRRLDRRLAERSGIAVIAWTVDELVRMHELARPRRGRHRHQRPAPVRPAARGLESRRCRRTDSRSGTGMALFAMGLGVLVIANDFTALNVALPAIEQDFDVDVGTIQWTINAYALTFGMVLVTGGRLADMFGRRRIFFIGTAIFATFSLLGGLAQSAAQLIAMRVGMGVGGGLMWPAILGMTFAAVPASRAAFAGGLVLGVAGLGNAIGPLLGGFLTDEFSWRAIFFLNIPVAAFAVAVTAAKVHQPVGRLGTRADRLRGHRHAVARPGAPSPGARPVRRLGLGRPARARDDRSRDRLVLRLRRDRAADARGGAGPGVGDAQPRLRGRLSDDPVPLRGLLQRPALRAAADGEGARRQRARGRARDAADARHVRRRRVPLRAADRAGGHAPGDPGRHPAAGRRAAAAVVLRCRLRVPEARTRPARDRRRRGPLLPDDHHGGRRDARRIAVEPGRRHRLHVPGGRRRHRPRAVHRPLHDPLGGRARRRRERRRPRDDATSRSP